MAQQHRLFFALRPTPGAVQAIVAARQQACERHGLKGRPVAAERLHVTLHWLADHDEFPRALCDAACAAGAKLAAEPFDVRFDQVGSIGGARDPGPLVLSGGENLAALRRFQRALGDEMKAAGIGHYARSHFKPHVSLLYPGVYVAREAIEPLEWRVDELLLIDSHVGAGVHELLGRWPLRQRQGVLAW